MALRAKGNELYSAGDLEEALSTYQAAVDSGDDLARGNVSAALYELGRYNDAILSSVEAARYIRKHGDRDDEKYEARIAKLWIRAATCALLEQKWDEAEKYAIEAGEKGEEIVKTVKSRNKKKMSMKNYEEERKLPMIDAIVRPVPYTRKFAMVAWSHGEPLSMIDGPIACPGSEHFGRWEGGSEEARRVGKEVRKKMRIDLKGCGEDGEKVNIFMGGVGDCRHIFETLRDVHGSIKEGESLPDVRIVVNDIREEVLARAVVMFALFFELGRFDKDLILGDAKGYSDDTKGRANAQKDVKESQIRFEKDEKYSEALDFANLVYHAYISPFLLPHHHAKVLKLVKSLAAAKSSPYPWITTEDAKVWEQLRVVFEFWASDPVDVDGMDKYTPDNNFDGSSAMRKLVFGGKMQVDFPTLFSRWEEELIKVEKVVAPSASLWEKYSKQAKLSKGRCGERSSVKHDWKPNFTIYAMDNILTAAAYRESEHHYAPLANIENICQHSKNGVALGRSFFDKVSFWFVEVAQAVRALAKAGVLKLDFALGDMHKVAVCQDRRAFDRCFGSNVSDYCHFVNGMLFLGPLLKDCDRPGYLIHDIRLAPELYTDLTEYFHSNTLLTSVDDCNRVFGLKLAGGSLFGPLPYYTPAIGEKMKRSDLESWLHRLLLAIAFPPRIKCTEMNREISSLTMVSFLEVLVRLVEIGYPKHWIAGFLETIMKQTIMSSASPPKRSPNPVSHSLAMMEKKKIPLATGVLLMEIRSLLGHYLDGRLPFGIPSTFPNSHWYGFPEQVRKMLLVGPQGDTKDFMTHPCLGIMIYKATFEKQSIGLMKERLQTCRRNWREFADPHWEYLSLFSAFKWSLTFEKNDRSLSMYLCEDLRHFLANNCGVAYIIRIDEWMVMEPGLQIPMRLSTIEAP